MQREQAIKQKITISSISFYHVSRSSKLSLHHVYIFMQQQSRSRECTHTHTCKLKSSHDLSFSQESENAETAICACYGRNGWNLSCKFPISVAFVGGATLLFVIRHDLHDGGSSLSFFYVQPLHQANLYLIL